MERREYKVFISATLDDLQEYRAAAQRAVQQLGHEAVLLDDLVASGVSPMSLSRTTIAACDVFISLIAWRYGFVPPDENPDRRSYVELELRHAWELKKPTFVFMAKDDAPWPFRLIDTGESAERLRAFREDVLRRDVVGFFTSPEDLSRQVMAALSQVPTPSQSRQDRDDPIPPTMDRYELAWRLVVDFKAEPALLRSLDPGELLNAIDRWRHEARPAQAVDGPLVDELMQHLRLKQSNLSPDPLWLAWMRATASGQTAP